MRICPVRKKEGARHSHNLSVQKKKYEKISFLVKSNLVLKKQQRTIQQSCIVVTELKFKKKMFYKVQVHRALTTVYDSYFGLTPSSF